MSAVTQVANIRSWRLLERSGAHLVEEFSYRDILLRKYTFARSMFGNVIKEKLMRYVSSGTRLFEARIEWGNMPLQVTYYLGNEPTPGGICVVRASYRLPEPFCTGRETGKWARIYPARRTGGKGRESEETLRREMLEETGWTMSHKKLLGFMHLHHLGAKPENYKYPYPDFLWPIYLAEAGEFSADAKIRMSGCLNLNSGLLKKKAPLDKGELLLLDAALKQR